MKLNIEHTKPNELDDMKLHEQVLHLAKSERKLTLIVIENLEEIEHRKIHLKRGYNSMFTYACKYLGYSQGAASRRVSAMRTVRECPEIKTRIEKGEVNLTQVAKAANFFYQEKKHNQKTFTPKEKAKVIENLSGKNTIETDRYLAELNPKIAQLKSSEKVVTPELIDLRMTISKETHEQLQRLRQLKPGMDSAELLSYLLNRVLKQIDPLSKPPKSNSSSSTPSSLAGNGNHRRSATVAVMRQRRPLPMNTKQLVWHRDKGSCQYIDPQTHRRCLSQAGLEIDHCQPLALGGDDSPENLRLLCRDHHKMRTEETFG